MYRKVSYFLFRSSTLFRSTFLDPNACQKIATFLDTRVGFGPAANTSSFELGSGTVRTYKYACYYKNINLPVT